MKEADTTITLEFYNDFSFNKLYHDVKNSPVGFMLDYVLQTPDKTTYQQILKYSVLLKLEDKIIIPKAKEQLIPILQKQQLILEQSFENKLMDAVDSINLLISCKGRDPNLSTLCLEVINEE